MIHVFLSSWIYSYLFKWLVCFVCVGAYSIGFVLWMSVGAGMAATGNVLPAVRRRKLRSRANQRHRASPKVHAIIVSFLLSVYE